MAPVHVQLDGVVAVRFVTIRLMIPISTAGAGHSGRTVQNIPVLILDVMIFPVVMITCGALPAIIP